MQHIAIKEISRDGKTVYGISAISLKNKNQSIVQRIPHPMGTDMLEYPTLDQAKEAIERSGFMYILPNGKKGISSSKNKINQTPQLKTDYKNLIYETIKSKITSNNSNVNAAAIMALAEFPTEETFEILFEKLGEENDSIRKNAISGISRYGQLLQEKLINTLSDNNWICRNSAITCIKNIIESENDINLEKFIVPLSKTCQDANPIVQVNAISTLAQVYNKYRSKD